MGLAGYFDPRACLRADIISSALASPNSLVNLVHTGFVFSRSLAISDSGRVVTYIPFALSSSSALASKARTVCLSKANDGAPRTATQL